MNAETALQRNIRLAVNRTGRARLLRNHVGSTERHIPFGLGTGSADLVGVLRNGRGFCLEIKTPVGRLSTDQKRWLAATRKWNVFACVARSIEDAMAALDRAEQGACE